MRYDILGRTQSSMQGTSVFGYGYAPVGLTSEKYPTQRLVTYGYDGAGRISSVAGPTTNYATLTTNVSASTFAYAPHGGIQKMTLGNQIVETTGYNSRLQPVSIQAGTSSSLLTLGYGYGESSGNDNGNVLSQTITRGSQIWTQTFNQYGTAGAAYDGVNRLIGAAEAATATATGTPWSLAYGYDNAGNRAITSASFPQNLAAATNTNQYSAANRIVLQSDGVTAMPSDAYDPSGNLTHYPGMGQFTYDAENRLTTATVGSTTTSSVYDGEGRRVGKTDSSGTTTYVYDAMGELAVEYPAVLSTAVGTKYLTVDALGSTRLVTDAGTGGVVNQVECEDYLPFGEQIQNGVNGRTATCFAAADAVPEKKFTSKERDAESGLDYFGARYFSSAQGRWTSPDWSASPTPVPYARLDNPQTLNLYAYVGNNPLSRFDPDGHYIVNCGEGDKDCNTAAADFETQRQKDLSSKSIKVRNAAGAWGDPGKDNHITVTFRTQQQVDADAHTAPGFTTNAMVTPGATADHTPTIKAEFSESLKGSDLGQTIAHEGSHIKDNMNFLNSYNPVTGMYSAWLNFTHFDTEFQAFGAGSQVKSYPMFPSGPRGYRQLDDYIHRAYPNADSIQFNPARWPQQ